jgi:hypothetical protein
MTDDLKQIWIQILINLLLILIFLIILLKGTINSVPYGLISISSITFIFASIAWLFRGTFRYKRLLYISKFILFTGLISLLIYFILEFTMR